MKKYEIFLKNLNDKNEYMANYDQLTGLPNRRFLYKKLEESIVLANNNEAAFFIGIMDIDNFKDINDEYGHLCGDKALKSISKTVIKTIRKKDIVGRWGGEEFLIILSDTNLKDGYDTMERIRDNISKMNLECDGLNMLMTVTIGCSKYVRGLSLDEIIKNADKLLYQGKETGKNIVVNE